MKGIVGRAVALAGLILAVFVFGSAAASVNSATARRAHVSAARTGMPKAGGVFTKEREEELERENVEDEEIVKREVALESATVEREEQEELASIQAEQEGMPPGEELAPTIESYVLKTRHQSVESRFKAWVFPHGTRTHVVAIADWAEKCNTVSKQCPRKGHYHHARLSMGTLTNFKKKKAAMVQTILFDRQGCQVMEYWIYATNRWGQTQLTGWAGKCISGKGE
jgi:hypothetical protein